MSKEAYYFSHDYGSRNDPKIQKLLMKLGQAGKGVFWDLVEMLYEEGGYLLLSECESYAFALRTDLTCITSLINDFGLFSKDDERFWSDSVLRRIEKRNEKSKKAAESALKRWNNANASKDNANALQIESESNAIKERKGKDIKEENVIPELTLPTPATGSVSFKSRAEKFIDLFNQTRMIAGKPSKFRLNEKLESTLKARLKVYKPEEIIQALKTAMKDPNHIESNFKYITPEFILRVDKLEKFLNQVYANPILNVYTGPVKNTINHAV